MAEERDVSSPYRQVAERVAPETSTAGSGQAQPTTAQPSRSAEMDAALRRLQEILAGGQSTERNPAGTPQPASAPRVALDEFIQVASEAVLRAIDARNQRVEDERSAGGAAGERRLGLMSPITLGLIFWPPSLPGGIQSPPDASGAREAGRQ